MQSVLVIDDDIDIANLFGMVLGLAGYKFEVAYSAGEASPSWQPARQT